MWQPSAERTPSLDVPSALFTSGNTHRHAHTQKDTDTHRETHGHPQTHTHTLPSAQHSKRRLTGPQAWSVPGSLTALHPQALQGPYLSLSVRGRGRLPEPGCQAAAGAAGEGWAGWAAQTGWKQQSLPEAVPSPLTPAGPHLRPLPPARLPGQGPPVMWSPGIGAGREAGPYSRCREHLGTQPEVSLLSGVCCHPAAELPGLAGASISSAPPCSPLRAAFSPEEEGRLGQVSTALPQTAASQLLGACCRDTVGGSRGRLGPGAL